MQMMLKVGRKKMVTGLSGGNAVALRVALRSQSARARARRRVQGRLCCLHLFLASPFSRLNSFNEELEGTQKAGEWWAAVEWGVAVKVG